MPSALSSAMSSTGMVLEPIGSLMDDDILDDLQLDLGPRLGTDRSSRTSNPSKLSLQFSDKSLCRGVGVTKVLRRFGKLFNHSLGTEEDYQLGQEVHEVSAFITHNWSLKRWKKCMALCCYFHIVPACIVSLVVQLFLFVLVLADKLPLIRADYVDVDGIDISETAREYHVGCWCMVGGWSAFWLTLFLWADVAAMFGRSGPTVFVDKVCIDQVNIDRKKQGILAIPAWLACSDTLVAVFSDELLVKLWTCFELCTFVALGRTDKIRVEPALLSYASFFVSMFLLILLIWNQLLLMGDDTNRVLQSALGLELCVTVAVLGYSGLLLLIFAVLAHWGRVCHRIRKQVHELDIRTAACFDEADRALVLQALQSLGDRHIFHRTDSEDKHVDELTMAELTVKMRSQLENAFVRSVGFNRLPIKYLVASLMPLLGDMLDYLGADVRMQQLRAHEREPGTIAGTLQQVAASFLFRVSPLLLASSLFCLGAFVPVMLLPKCAHNWTRRLHLIGLSLSLVCWFAAIMAYPLVGYIRAQEVVSDLNWFLLAAADVIAVGWLCYLYGPVRRPKGD
ncbi:unnamed protein product [Polarella glacialis]|uniref:Transmembrane protein n=1 Tax=Polarella glacialis TaxID=89957 RepID=A0A813D4E0_POLGL|nr:unnamed protein product [Polarella glacialis]CAE8714588.1 unnamed protein product [Polarella glacialis]